MRRLTRSADALLQTLPRLKEPDQVAADRGAGEAGKRLGLNRTPVNVAVVVGCADHLKRFQWRRVVALGPGEDLMLDPAVDQPPARPRCGKEPHWKRDRRPPPRQDLASTRRTRSPIDAALGLLFEELRGHDAVGESDSVRLGTVNRLAGKDHLKGPRQTDEVWQTLGASPSRNDAEVDLR